MERDKAGYLLLILFVMIPRVTVFYVEKSQVRLIIYHKK